MVHTSIHATVQSHFSISNTKTATPIPIRTNNTDLVLAPFTNAEHIVSLFNLLPSILKDAGHGLWQNKVMNVQKQDFFVCFLEGAYTTAEMAAQEAVTETKEMKWTDEKFD